MSCVQDPKMAWSNDVTFKFIDLYQSESSIWDPRNKAHKDKTKINNAWDRISEEMGLSVAELKKKKETLMAAFRLNHKKKLSSLKTAISEDDVFKPIWIFYEPLAAFMSEVYDCKSHSNTEEGTSTYSASHEKWNPFIEIGVEELSNGETSHYASHSSKPSLKRRRSDSPLEPHNPDHNAHCSTFVTQALSTISNIFTTQLKNQPDDDECDIYGKLIAKKLRRFPEFERLECMYEIDSVFLQKRIKLEPRESSPAGADSVTFHYDS